MEPRFFDYNATTPLWPEAKAEWSAAVDACWLNPSSPYRQAAAVKVRLEAARESLAELFKVSPSRIVFNSGGTEGNHSVFAYWGATLRPDSQVAVSRVEHPSVIEAARSFFPERVSWLQVGRSGRVDIDELQQRISAGQLAAVSVMAANNETGICQPWKEIASHCADAGLPYHCDASQWIGKMDLSELGACSYVTGCAHKFGGPRGVGFLILPQSGAESFKSLRGGEQEAGHRGGTENVAGILAMVKALRVTQESTVGVNASFRDRFLDQLRVSVPEVIDVSEGCIRLWNTACIILPEFASARWIGRLEKKGFLVSAGSACSTGKEGPSHVLAAMNISASETRRALRISSGWTTRAADWLELEASLSEVYDELKKEAASEVSSVISID